MADEPQNTRTVDIRLTQRCKRKLEAYQQSGQQKWLSAIRRICDPVYERTAGYRLKRLHGRDHLWSARVDKGGRILFAKRRNHGTRQAIYIVLDFDSHDEAYRAALRLAPVADVDSLEAISFTVYDSLEETPLNPTLDDLLEVAAWEFLPNVDDMLKTLEGQFLVPFDRLTDEQKLLADPDYAGPILIDGVPGSGKTTVALYRALRLKHAHPDSRILYCCLSPALLTRLQFMLGHLVAEHSLPRDNIDLLTPIELLLSILSQCGDAPSRAASL